MTDDVGLWLESHGFGKYSESFTTNDIAFDVLPDLSEGHLKELGVTIGDRIRLLKIIAAQSSHGDLKESVLRHSDTASATGAGERRQLAVVFSDLVGSTELSTRLDPEDLQEVIRAYQDSVGAAVKLYDGFVAKFMGDGVLVYFGYPQAHEGDSERATRAGLAIVDAMAELNDRFASRFDIALDVRIGIATGPVVVGDIIGEGAAEEAAVVGETPNLAARLQALAQPNQVVVSAHTRELLGATFEYEDMGVHTLKGIAEPAQAWRVVDETEFENQVEAGYRSAGVPIVGRHEELGLLSRAWETGKQGRGQVVLLQGEGGIGKSRLVEALRTQIADEPHTWVAIRCSPYHTNSMLYPVIEHLSRVAGWARADDPDDKIEKLEAALAGQSIPLAEAMPLFASLMSLPLPEDRYPPLEITAGQRRERFLDALVNWLFEEAEKSPVLQLWEDLHWADPTTLDLAELYISQSPTVAMLNVFTYRPDFTPPWPMRSHMTPITLNRLERPEVEALILNRTGGKTLPAEVIGHIIEKADGVPLYVEELTKSILNSDALCEEADRYVIAGELDDAVIPASLHDSLMARLDRLPALREVAQMGSVLGREFAYEMLRGVAGLDETQLRTGLQQLVADELLYQRGRLPQAKYIFKHALIQDAAYQSLLKRTRQKWHERVAQQLEAQFRDTLDSHPELAAHHYTEAGNLKQAVRYWREAGEQARDRSAYREAIAYLSKGIEALKELPESPENNRMELALQLALGHANIIARGHGAVEAEAAYERALVLCRQLGDVPELVPTLFGFWRFCVGARSMNETREIAAQLGRLARSKADPELSVIADYALGYTDLCRGELDAAQGHLRSGIDRYEPEQRVAAVYRAAQDPGVACSTYLAMTQWLRGRPETAQDHLRAAIDLAERIEDSFSLAYIKCFVGPIVSEATGGDTAAMVEEGLTLAVEGGFSLWVAYGKVQQVFQDLRRNCCPDALETLQLTVAAISDLGVQINVPYYLTLLARGYLAADRRDDALAALADAMHRIEARDERWWESEVARLQGESCVDDKDATKSLQWALEIARGQGALSLELRAAISLAQRMGQSERPSDARNILAQCLGKFDEGKETPDLKTAIQLLQDLD